MPRRRYGSFGPWVSGRDDSVTVTTCVKAGVEVEYFQGMVMVDIGLGTHMYLTLQQAVDFRALLDMGIADGLAEGLASGALTAAEKAVAE